MATVPAAHSPVPKAQSPLQKVVHCIVHLPVTSSFKAPLLFVVVIVGSTFDALDMSPETAFSDVRNLVNQKFTWGWSLLVLPTVLIMSVLYTTAMDWKTVAKHMVHLTVAHIIWYLVTTFFVVVNIITGTCTDETATAHYTCLKSGHQWYSLDISGHVFLLTYYICVLTEECAAIKAEVWNHYTVLFQEHKVTNWLVKLLELLATVEIILMTVMLCATAFYFHTFVEKLLGYVFGLTSWYMTYRWLYGKLWKKNETSGDDKPISVLSPSAATEPTANWQYQELSRKSAEIATALAANRLAGKLASHLKAKGIIGQHVLEQATNYGPDVNDFTRVQYLITAVATKTKYNPQCYHDFIKVLELDGIRPDTEAARSLLPAAMPPTATTCTTSSSGGKGTRLKKEALPELLNLLSPVVSSWDLFVQQIGVPSDQISQIKVANPQTGPSYLYRCFTQALEWWVANHDNPVYESMIDTLDPGIDKMTPVMNRALARELREFMAKQRGEQKGETQMPVQPPATLPTTLPTTHATYRPVHSCEQKGETQMPVQLPATLPTTLPTTHATYRPVHSLVNLADLIEHVTTPRWYKLGLVLGVNDTSLRFIEIDMRGDSETGLRRMFREWLRSSEQPSWDNVIWALRRIGENKLAAEISQKLF